MKNTFLLLLPAILLLSACGTMRETASVNDDVYDIPDRKALAARAAAARQARNQDQDSDAYYDPAESEALEAANSNYYDLAYNNPYYYNYGRFGFGTGIGSYGPGFGMGLSYGWPTSFGNMSVGYGYGYNPYWGNGIYGYDPYAYYGYGNYGYGYGGYGMGYGYGPYQGPLGPCRGCYEPIGYGNTVYSHRPSMSAGSSSTTVPYAPRMMRNPAGLIPDTRPSRGTDFNRNNTPNTWPSRVTTPRTPSRTHSQPRPGKRTTTSPSRTSPSRNFNFGGNSPSRSGGGNTGGSGGRISSPRPR